MFGVLCLHNVPCFGNNGLFSCVFSSLINNLIYKYSKSEYTWEMCLLIHIVLSFVCYVLVVVIIALNTKVSSFPAFDVWHVGRAMFYF